MPRPFDQARPQLETQYQDIRFDPESGWSGGELLAELDRHRAEYPDEPRIMTRAWLFKLICDQGRIAPEPDDYFSGKLEHHDLLLSLRKEWMAQESEREFRNDPPPAPGFFKANLDISHTSPDWRALLSLGFTGLRERALKRVGTFYEAVTLAYDGATALCRRLGQAANSAALSALAERPPETFHEALQLAYFYHELQEMEGEPVRSMGRFDQLYISFYRNDLQSGRLTRDQAKELLKYFWIKFCAKTGGKGFGKNFLFGPEVNELSRLGFEVYREMRTVDPKLSVRVGADTPNDFLEQVTGCVLDGCTGIVFANDPAQTHMLIENGKTPEDAADYLLIGCYEPAVMGKELNCSGSTFMNLAKCLKQTLAVAEPASFAPFLEAYFHALDAQLAQAMERTLRNERMWPRVNPSPLLSGTMSACIESGRDVSDAGAQYNTSGVLFAGLANAVDSLAVIEQLVYREKTLFARPTQAGAGRQLGRVRGIAFNGAASRSEVGQQQGPRRPAGGHAH